MRNIYTAFVLALMLSTISCEINTTRNSTKNGVKYVRNRNKPKDDVFQLVPKKIFSIENIAFKENQGGSINQCVAVDKLHNIFVYNKNDSQISKYDKSGKLLLKFGGLGYGPGEIISANNIHIEEDVLKVLIMQEKKYNHYDLNGNFIKCTRVQDALATNNLPIGYDDNIQFYYSNFTAVDSNSTLRHMTFFNDQYLGKELAVLNNTNNDSNIFEKIILFDEFTKVSNDKFAEENLKHFCNYDKIYLAENDKNSFKYHVYNADGQKILTVSKDYRKVKYQKSYIAKLKLREGMFMPNSYKYVQSISDIKSDKYGNVWIRSNEDHIRAKYLNHYQIFNKDGEYTNKIDFGKITNFGFINELTFRDKYMFVYGFNKNDNGVDALYVYNY